MSDEDISEGGRRPVRARRRGYSVDLIHYESDEKMTPKRFVVTVNRYRSGRIAEVFIDAEKHKSADANVARDAATLISIAIQNGTDIADLADSTGHGEVNVMGKAVSRPHTLIGTVLDYLKSLPEIELINDPDARALGPARITLETKPPPPLEKRQLVAEAAPPPPMPKITSAMSREMGYTGDECTKCNNYTMVRNGSCLKCDTCGETTGCS